MPLWLIGWLIVGVPLFGFAWLLNVFNILDSGGAARLLLATLLIGDIFVAPLVALGKVHFYLYARNWSPEPGQVPVAASSQ